ncbi:(R)-mandelonitrile lyase 1-like [Cucumis melo var. makuwa]|uniref:(R)-mandelonitrile lyase 1-like n=1 Tax=Cucumis melo var. makuwa TaxID=1194695 RepID=A0A5D3BL58_CUCMM|nr:(R)-mandelonitrile lyase 1-like [Cucumis melo var. makuwa]
MIYSHSQRKLYLRFAFTGNALSVGWFDSDNNKSHRTHVELDYKSINTLRFWFDEELVILAIKAHQVVYLEDLQNGSIGNLFKWSKVNIYKTCSNWKILRMSNLIYWKSLSDIVRMNTLRMTLNADDPQPTRTLRRRQHSQNLEFDRYIKKNGKILISIVLGGDKPISPHVIRFSNTIGVLTRDTFPIHYLKWADVPPEYIEVIKGGLQEESRINKAARANQPYNYNSGLKSFLQ